MRDALEATSAPAIFSHSNARALRDVPRNVPHDVLALIPGNGGMVMAIFVSFLVTTAPQATLADVVSKLECVREVVGPRTSASAATSTAPTR